jgi:hypothetical protein
MEMEKSERKNRMEEKRYIKHFLDEAEKER